MKNKNQWFLGMSLVLALSACGKTKDESPKSGSAVAQQGDWVQLQHRVSKDGSVIYDQRQITPSGLAHQQQLYQRTNLVQLPIDARYKAQVFRVADESIEDYKNKLFVAPKLFSYGSQQAGSWMQVAHEDGSATLSFNVAFVDGINKTIQSPQGDEKGVKLPDNFMVMEQDDLKNLLREKYHADNGLAPLYGCPKKLVLTVSGRDFDVTPSNYKTADFCQLNAPVTVSVTLSRGDIDQLEEALYKGLVDISGLYETRVSVPVVKVSIKFDRQKLFDDLQMRLKANVWMLDVDVKNAVTQSILNQMMKVSIQGDTSEHLNQMIDQVMSEFFDKMPADPVTGMSDCGSAPVCFRLSHTSVERSSEMSFEWAQSSNSMVGETYVTSTKLKSTPAQVTLGKERDCKVNCDRVANDGIPRETGLTVVNGNKLEIVADYMVRKSMSELNPRPVRTDNSVIVGYDRVCDHAGSERGGIVCENIPKRENHWVDTTSYDAGTIQEEIIDQPVGLLNMLYEGLWFSFRWRDSQTGESKQVECPIGVFSRYADGRTLTVKIENVPTCKPFSQNQNEVPMLFLVNKINSQTRFRSGVVQQFWDGRVSDQTTIVSKTTPIDFVGSISVLGFSSSAETRDGHLKDRANH